jgi:hypothetical protein
MHFAPPRRREGYVGMRASDQQILDRHSKRESITQREILHTLYVSESFKTADLHRPEARRAIALEGCTKRLGELIGNP